MLSVALVINYIKISLRAVGVVSGQNALSTTYLKRLLTESLQVFTNIRGATGKK